MSEIDASSFPEQGENGLKVRRAGRDQLLRRKRDRTRHVGMRPDPRQFPPDLLGSHDKVDAPSGYGMAWHAVILRAAFTLGKGDASLRFNFLQTKHSI